MESGQWWGQGFGFMWIFPLTFLVVFLFFMRGMFSGGVGGWGGHGNDSSHAHRESAREILDRRFASGEISKEAYESMKRTLGSGTA